MNLQECIATGKPFTHVGMNDYIKVGGDWLVWVSDNYKVGAIPVMLLASKNWETMEAVDNVVPFNRSFVRKTTTNDGPQAS